MGIFAPLTFFLFQAQASPVRGSILYVHKSYQISSQKEGLYEMRLGVIRINRFTHPDKRPLNVRLGVDRCRAQFVEK